MPVILLRSIIQADNRAMWKFFYAEFANGTNETVRTIDLQSMLHNPSNAEFTTVTRTYSVTILSGQIVPFLIAISRPNEPQHISSKIISWTSSLTPTYQPVFVKSVETSVLLPRDLLVTTTVQNTSTQTLTEVQLTIWQFAYAEGIGIDEGVSGVVDIHSIDVGELHPGQLYTATAYLRYVGSVSEKTVRVAGYGVIPP
jgi:hypothetical protein